jgi:SAM-dependent methyltransferase
MDNLYDQEEFFEAYSQMSRSRQGLAGAGEWHQLKELFPDLTGRDVLDLGCGYGWHCRYAVEQGARRVVGIDLSEKMIAEAKKRGGPIGYRVCGLDRYEYPEAAFDCVVSNLVLHYIEDLEEVYRKVFRTLRPGGVFLFNIEHPVFTGSVNQEWVLDAEGRPRYWPVDRYFETGERVAHFLGQRVVKQHHTLTQIVMGLLRSGFQLEALEEAVPPEEMLDQPGMRDELRRPMMLMIRARKG